METARAILTPGEAREQAEAMIAELKQARMLQEWNKEETSRRAGLERHVVGKNEEGVTQPKLATFIRWASPLGYEVVLRKRRKLSKQDAAFQAKLEKLMADSDSSMAEEIRADMHQMFDNDTFKAKRLDPGLRKLSKALKESE